MIIEDKSIERARYDARAEAKLNDDENAFEAPLGSQTMPEYLRTPYFMYERKITESIQPCHKVLELGAGAGLHTRILLQTGAKVVASDISEQSLNLLKKYFQISFNNFETAVADMEHLPFDENSFDVVVCAGSLSYGDPNIVDAQIKRVLKSGGILICVDSLNHNPIYRFNRWMHYLRGDRSISTLTRMPTLHRIDSLTKGFSVVDLNYFGSLSFLMPFCKFVLGEHVAYKLSNKFDNILNIKRSAFKFVLVARGLNKVVVG
jgi:SAM-dependent methyltransferase